MTETKAPAETAPESAVQARNAYLPVPPDGWEYKIELIGPRGARVTTTMRDLEALPPEYRDGDTVVVEVHTSSRHTKTFRRPSLKSAVRAAVEAAKALNVIAEHEARAQEATEKLLDTIGGDAETPQDRQRAAAETGKALPVPDVDDAKASTDN